MAGSRQLYTNLWADTGTKVQPTPGEIDAGWSVAKPFWQWANWRHNRADEMLGHIESNGIPVWHASTTYDEHGRTIGSDGKMYRSQIAANVGNDPTIDAGSNWRHDLLFDSSFTADGYMVMDTYPEQWIVQWGTVVVGANLVGDPDEPEGFKDGLKVALNYDYLTINAWTGCSLRGPVLTAIDEEKTFAFPSSDTPLAHIILNNPNTNSSTVNWFSFGW